MKNNMVAIIAIIIAIIAIFLSFFAIAKVNSIQEKIPLSTHEQRIDDDAEEVVNEAIATHPFDSSLIGKWTNGYWNLEICDNSTILLDNKSEAEAFTGYIENNKILVEYKMNCSINEYLADPEGCDKKEFYSTADIIIEATDSFRIDRITGVQPGLSFRRIRE